jgi:Flp pilus assembly protein TadD
VKALVARLKDATQEQRVQPFLKGGEKLERFLHWDDAIEAYKRAVEIAPKNGQARVRLAYTLLASGRDEENEGMGHAQKGVQLLPNEAEAHYVLGRYCEIAGDEKKAKTHYARALELRPAYQEVKKRLSKLRWGF